MYGDMFETGFLGGLVVFLMLSFLGWCIIELILWLASFITVTI